MPSVDELQLSPAQRSVVERFAALSQGDDRISAAFIGGSFARGAADEHSDLDLFLVVTEEHIGAFRDARTDLLHQLGEPLFHDTFDSAHTICFILAGDVEGELNVTTLDDVGTVHVGPCIVVMDRDGVLAGRSFSGHEADAARQTDLILQTVAVFWHDFGHLTKALARDQLWWAAGQLAVLRQICVSLARFRSNPMDLDAVSDPYFKVDQVVAPGLLDPLDATFTPRDRARLIAGAWRLVAFYREQAAALTAAAGLSYPHELDRLLTDRLARLDLPR